MMNQGSIAFVRGVDKHGASPPDGFPYRFAILTWFDHEGDGIDPWPLMKLAIPRVAVLVGPDSVMAEYWERYHKGIIFRTPVEKKVREVSWERLMESSDEALLEEEFPSRFRFLCGDRVVLLAESEMWSWVGGPLPYHDSVTVSFFSRVAMDEPLRNIFIEEAGKLGLFIG